MKPSCRGRTLNVSMALATLGLLILRSASITKASSGWCSERVPAPPDELLAQHVGGLPDGLEVRVHGESPLEEGEGLLGTTELEIDHPVAAEGAEVIRVALHHLVAIGQRLLVLSHQVV